MTCGMPRLPMTETDNTKMRHAAANLERGVAAMRPLRNLNDGSVDATRLVTHALGPTPLPRRLNQRSHKIDIYEVSHAV